MRFQDLLHGRWLDAELGGDQWGGARRPVHPGIGNPARGGTPVLRREPGRPARPSASAASAAAPATSAPRSRSSPAGRWRRHRRVAADRVRAGCRRRRPRPRSAPASASASPAAASGARARPRCFEGSVAAVRRASEESASIEPSGCKASRPATFAFWIAPRERSARAAYSRSLMPCIAATNFSVMIHLSTWIVRRIEQV